MRHVPPKIKLIYGLPLIIYVPPTFLEIDKIDGLHDLQSQIKFNDPQQWYVIKNLYQTECERLAPAVRLKIHRA